MLHEDLPACSQAGRHVFPCICVSMRTAHPLPSCMCRLNSCYNKISMLWTKPIIRSARL